MSSTSLPRWISEKAYWLSQWFAVRLINQYAKGHDEGFHIETDGPGRYQYHGLSAEPDELASLEGMLRLGVPWLWLAPAFWGAIIFFTTSPGLLQFGGTVLSVIGAAGWYSASRFSSNTTVEYGITPPMPGIEQLQRRGYDDVSEAIFRIEQVEDELSRTDGVEDVREQLTDARVELVDALVEREVGR